MSFLSQLAYKTYRIFKYFVATPQINITYKINLENLNNCCFKLSREVSRLRIASDD